MADALIQIREISSQARAVPMVRTTPLDSGLIGRALDAGAMGVICPMINTASDAAALVSACRYPPAGDRSWGPHSVSASADPLGYFRTDSQRIAVLAMIETAEALGNVADILATPGLDGVFVGPSDLAISLGHAPAAVPTEPAVLTACHDVAAAAVGCGKAAAIYCGDGAMAARMFDAGFGMCAVGSDLALMSLGTKAEVATAKRASGAGLAAQTGPRAVTVPFTVSQPRPGPPATSTSSEPDGTRLQRQPPSSQEPAALAAWADALDRFEAEAAQFDIPDAKQAAVWADASDQFAGRPPEPPDQGQRRS